MCKKRSRAPPPILLRVRARRPASQPASCLRDARSRLGRPPVCVDDDYDERQPRRRAPSGVERESSQLD